MRISIITCTRNSEPWIAECIASVRAQDYPDIEHIFVDGDSSDGTLERIRALDGRVRLLTGYRDGLSRAMNAGVEAATGEVIAHLHSDDLYVAPDVVSRVMAAFEQQPQRDWLYGRCKYIIDGQMRDNDFVTKPFSLRELGRSNVVPHPATFIRRSAFLECGGFDTSYRYAMDYDLWRKLAQRGPPIQLSDYLAAFRFHDGGLSTANVWACHNEFLKIQFRRADANPLEWAGYLARHAYRGAQIWLDSIRGRPST